MENAVRRRSRRVDRRRLLLLLLRRHFVFGKMALAKVHDKI